MARREVCDFVIENWELFKVCECCDSILDFKNYICPVCKSYRFDKAEKTIKQMAKIFKTKPRRSLLDGDLF